jgi:hypothetical protein
MAELNSKIGEMEFDGLVTDIVPPVQVRGGTVAKVSEATIYKRGTILAKSATDNTLSVLGGGASGDTLTADCILCDDTEVGTAGNITAMVYTAGCFDPAKCVVADGYTLSEKDKNELRMRGIVFKAASSAK